MFDQNRRDTERSETTPQIPVPTRESLLQSPSLFVASIIEVLRQRKPDSVNACAEHLARHGALSGTDFSVLVDTLPHPSQTSEILWAYSRLTRSSVEADFAQGLPAFLKIAHKCLLDSSDVDGSNANRVSRVLDRLLDARIQSDVVGDAVDVVVGPAERSLLQSISALADQKRLGYWECVELHGALFPDIESLESLFRAVDRLGPGPHEKAARLGVQRAVAAIGAGDFPTTFEFVARALGDCDRAGDVALRRAAAAGLSFHAERSLDDLLKFLNSDDETLLRFACRVCVSVDKDADGDEPPEELREDLAARLRVLVARFGDRGPGDPLVDDTLIALGHISPLGRDIEEIKRTVRGRLYRHEPLSAELMEAYAEGLSRVERQSGLDSLPTLSPTRFTLLDSPQSMDRKLDGRSWVSARHETEDDLEGLALDISVDRELERILEMCDRRQDLLDPSRLRSRQASSLSLFYKGSQALQFARHHASLATFGPAEFAAVLFPELLSALHYGRSAEKRNVGEAIGELALHSLASLAKLAAHDPKIRDLAVARLSSADWDLLGSLHTSNERFFSRAHPELGLAGFAVRSVIDDDTSWQKELLSWWGDLEPQTRDRMDPNALAFVGVVAERQRPGAVWDLLGQVPLWTEDRRAFSDIGLALFGRAEESVRRICVEIVSERGSDLGRSLILAQLLASHCGKEERAHLLGAAKGLLDEMGILGLDAVAAVGSLSRDRADALLLLEQEPVLGIAENVYWVSCAKAAARIFRNIEQGFAE